MEISPKFERSEKPLTCNSEKCTKCPIGPSGKGFCSGWSAESCGANGFCKMRTCHRECATCGGGEFAPNTVPVVCCKTPLSNLLVSKVEHDKHNFFPRPKIDLKQRLIVVTQGSVGARVKEPYPQETQAIAVNIRHVWSSRGWYSRDMKDYLKLRKDQKLILISMTHDDVLDKAWDMRLHEEDWSEVGFDYWQTIAFSYYGDESRLNQYRQFHRLLTAAERSRAWFASESPLRLTRKTSPIIADMASKIPQVMFNAQGCYKPTDLVDVLNNARRTDHVVPKNVAFWFVGFGAKKFIQTAAKFFAHRDTYFLSPGPWLAGHKGKLYTEDGKIKPCRIPKEELVVENQRRYMRMLD